MNFETFISYAQADKTYADAVCHKLESSGVRCWIAPRDISPSKDWAEEIIDGINSVSIMVLVFSSNSNDSPQVRREVERAVHKGVNILPFRIEDVPPSKSLEYFISSQHWLDAMTEPLEAHLDKLRETVATLLDKGPPGCPAEPSPGTPSQGTVPSAEADTSAPLPVSFEAADLSYIESQLAGYLGPMAKFLVKQAAAKASSFEQLVSLLAEELAQESERKSFLQSCRAKGK